MRQYLDLMQDILDTGVEKGDRTGTGTLSVFGRQMRFDLSESFPLLTTKKLHIRSIVYELLWFLNGDTNINYLNLGPFNCHQSISNLSEKEIFATFLETNNFEI